MRSEHFIEVISSSRDPYKSSSNSTPPLYFTVTKSGKSWFAQLREANEWVFVGRYDTKEAGRRAVHEHLAGHENPPPDALKKKPTRKNTSRVWEYKYVRKLGSRWRAEGYQGKNMLRAHLGMFATKCW